MITLLFVGGAGNQQVVKIRINGNNVTLNSNQLGSNWIPLENTVSNPSKIIREYPDLEKLPPQEIISTARERMKKKFVALGTEQQIKSWIIAEMESEVGLVYAGRK